MVSVRVRVRVGLRLRERVVSFVTGIHPTSEGDPSNGPPRVQS